MSFSKIYSAFERLVSAAILAGMVVVIVLAVISFLRLVLEVLGDPGAPLDYVVFQRLFDRVLAAIIAVEIAHSIRQMVQGAHGSTQLRTVVVIGMLAVVRKLILLEVGETSGAFLVGLAAVIFALAVAYWIINLSSDDTGQSATGPMTRWWRAPDRD